MISAPPPSCARRILAVLGYLSLAAAGLVALLPVALIFAWSVGAQHHRENYVGGAILFFLIGLVLLAGIGWALWRAFRVVRPGDDAGGVRALPVAAAGVGLALAAVYLLGFF